MENRYRFGNWQLPGKMKFFDAGLFLDVVIFEKDEYTYKIDKSQISRDQNVGDQARRRGFLVCLNHPLV